MIKLGNAQKNRRVEGSWTDLVANTGIVGVWVKPHGKLFDQWGSHQKVNQQSNILEIISMLADSIRN